MEKTLDELKKELADLQESLKLIEELARLQKSLSNLQKESRKKTEIKLRVSNGEIILPRGMSGKELSKIIQPKIISKTNFYILKRIHESVGKACNDLNLLNIEKLTEKEIEDLDYHVQQLLDCTPDFLNTKTEENETEFI